MGYNPKTTQTTKIELETNRLNDFFLSSFSFKGYVKISGMHETPSLKTCPESGKFLG